MHLFSGSEELLMAEKGARPEAKPMTGYSTYPHSPASIGRVYADYTFLQICRDQQAFFQCTAVLGAAT